MLHLLKIDVAIIKRGRALIARPRLLGSDEMGIGLFLNFVVSCIEAFNHLLGHVERRIEVETNALH